MSEAQAEPQAEPFVEKRWMKFEITPPPEGVEIEIAEDGALWRIKPRKVVQIFQSQPDPEAERRRIEAKQEAQFTQHVMDVMKARYLAEFDAEPEPVEEPEPAQLLPPVDALMSDYGPVGEEADITGDMLLEAFEVDAVETAAVVKTLSATRLKHLSEQLNVERAALDREHQATGVANPRSAAIDRLLALMTRRGEI
jgi:hypothetical protein